MDAPSPSAVDFPAAGPTPSPTVRLDRPRSVGDLATQIGLPLAALALATFAAGYVWSTRRVEHAPPPPAVPPRSPFAATLACAGVVEAQSENIAVGSDLSGVVVEVLVRVGDHVEAGTPLFRLDDRSLRADLEVRRAALSQARSELIRMEAEPRPESIPPLQAEVTERRAAAVASADARRRAEELFARQTITEQDLIEKQQAERFAEAAVEKAKAELALQEAGSWGYDRDVSRAAVTKAEAEVARIEVDLDRLTVRALFAGEVLQVNVRPGEYVGAGPEQSKVLLGDVDRLHVRADIDEFEIGRFDAAAPATALPRGAGGEPYPLTFVRVEPFVVPKKSLTGDNSERVDTRVLQVIYECVPGPGRRLFVGQQVDVFIEAGRGEVGSVAEGKESQ